MEPVNVPTRPVVQYAARLVTPVRAESAVLQVYTTVVVPVWILAVMQAIVAVAAMAVLLTQAV